MRVALVLATVLLAGAAAAQERPTTGNGGYCAKAVDCDCDGVKAGLVTREWRRDCRQCEAAIRSDCARILADTGSPAEALEKSRVCTSCPARGPNWRPKPPDPDGVDSGWAPAYKGQRKVRCAKGMVFRAGREGGLVFQGCVKADSKREGLWVVYDPATRTERVTVYADGRALHQVERTVPR